MRNVAEQRVEYQGAWNLRGRAQGLFGFGLCLVRLPPSDGDNLTIVAVTQGANGTVNITGSGKTLSYKPRNGFSGTDTFNYTISDGKGVTATAMVTVNVLKK
jgi:Bacterial Ig domain